MAAKDEARRIAYLMTRFPKITETFILREMDMLEQLGWWVLPFSLVREREYVLHPAVESFLGRTCFARDHIFAIVGANLAGFGRHPWLYLRLLGDTVWRFKYSPGTLARSLVCFLVAIYWAAVVRRERIAHIHAHFATYATYMAYVISRFTGIGYSFTAHAHDIYMDQTMLAEKVRKADLVVPISEFNRRLLASLCPEASAKIRVVYCGVDTETFHPFERPANDPGSPAEPLKIVAVARMQEYKGIRYLVAACRILRDRGIEFHSTLIGDGPQRREIEQAISHNGLRDVLDCVGWLPSSEVAAYIAQADVVVLPSVVARDGMMDGLPNVLMEALSCSVPVVSTTISGIPELVDSGRNGLLVPPADPDALADALAELAGDPARRRLMGEEGRKRVLATFDLINNTQQKARLLDNVVHRTLD